MKTKDKIEPDYAFIVYKEHVNKYLKEYGLLRWSISFSFEDFEDETTKASVTYCRYARSALFSLNNCKELMDEATYNDVKRSAFHEVMELLLADIRDIGLSEELGRSAKHLELDTAAHDVIRTLENVVFKESIDIT